MHLKKIIILSTCISSQLIHASMPLADDAKQPSTKPLKNNIFASVAKNPMPTAKTAPSTIDISTPKATVPDFKPLATTSAVEPKVTSQPKSIAAPKPVIAKAAAKIIEPISTDDDEKPITKVEPAPEIPAVKPEEPGVLYQQACYVDDDTATVAFNFEDANLSNLLDYMKSIHNIEFVSEDIVPTVPGAKGIAGHKINFRTNRTLTRKESWNLCVNFLHIAGLDVVPMVQTGFYRLVPLTKANNEPIPTYIGVDVEVLPDNDMIVRYVYFLRNIDAAKLQVILKNMQSASAKLDVYAELKGLIFTDRSSSIKSLMKIVTELDRAALPEVLSVVKLQRANAGDVITLYNSLKPSGGTTAQPQRVWATNKKESSLEYFPQDVVMVADNRTNSLILLGTKKDVQRIEEFITKNVDVAIDRDAPPIFTYRLQYTNAKDLTSILTSITSYGSSTEAGKYGGTRDGLKYFQKMTIVPDTWSNSLIINATPQDFAALKPLIEELDVAQKQIGLEILFVQVSDVDIKTLGAQISGPNGQGSQVVGASPFGPTFLAGASAQTSGVSPGTSVVVTRGTGATTTNTDFSIKSSLASLLGSNILNQAGSTLLTFGQPIWAVFKILKTITSTHVVSNPFLVVSNNTSATLTSGEERRQTSGEVLASAAVKATGLVPIQATLNVTITPQINKDNMISLQITVKDEHFVDGGATSGSNTGTSRSLKSIQTQATIANGETLVLGGIMIENTASSVTGVPFLEKIPVVGWFFKSKSRTITRDHFLIFVCPRVLNDADQETHVNDYTKYKLHEVQNSVDLIDEADWFGSSKDPVQNAFFGSKESTRGLQELRTGNNFARREAIDGKIDSKQKKVKKSRVKPTKQKKSKKKNSDEQNTEFKPAATSTRVTNAISKGVGNVS
jgi:general secretion pathway protein D